MTLILPLLISNGSWGSDLPECDGSPLDIVSSAEDAPLKLMMVFDWNNCQGKFTFDGERYFGEFKYGLLHGQGTYTHADGDQYDGEWKDGSEHGQGTYISTDGDKYVGNWKDGAAHGRGTYTWTSVINISENGRMTKGMVKELTPMRMGPKKKVSGKTINSFMRT